MTQDGLINNILKTCGMKHCELSQNTTYMEDPIRTDSLGKEVNIQEEWKYASVIGMLMYSASNFSPYIAFVFHQCVRFIQNF